MIRKLVAATLFLASVLMAQSPVTLQLGTATGAQSTFSVDLTLSNGPVRDISWSFFFAPGSISDPQISIAAAPTSVGKNLVCNSSPILGRAVCTLNGGPLAIPSGVIAHLTATMTAVDSNTHVGINVADVLALDLSGNPVEAAGLGGFATRLSLYTTLPLFTLRANDIGRGLTLDGGKLSVVPGSAQRGVPGAQGVAGAAGKDGKDGKDGLNGVNGTPGKDGKDGTAIVVNLNFMDDDKNAVYTNAGGALLSFLPNPASSVKITQNGLSLRQGIDFTVSGNLVTFLYNAPQLGGLQPDVMVISYRY